ncbi:unnamed protein product [Rotaria sordida]|uniref:Mitochondrial carrier protein n=1 Tax=Rotaria sordida TaxID=392033 RepID=A0A814G3U2_9BILA|nr:unnamed protein product [Rotaria sordida]
MNYSLFSPILSTIQYHQFIAGLFGGIISPIRGLQGLYGGVTSNVVGNGISLGLYLFIYNTIIVLNNDQDKIKNLTFYYRTIYSTTAGLLTIILTNPMWVIKTRMCLQYSNNKTAITYNNMFDAFRKTYQSEGITAFYKGLTPGLVGIFHGTIQFSSYEQMKSFYVNPFHTTYFLTSVVFTFSALSKFIAATSTYPIQVICTRLQDQHQNYNGVLDVIKKTYKRKGISGFFKGVVPALYRVIPASCITFVFYEFILYELKHGII